MRRGRRAWIYESPGRDRRRFLATLRNDANAPMYRSAIARADCRTASRIRRIDHSEDSRVQDRARRNSNPRWPASVGGRRLLARKMCRESGASRYRRCAARCRRRARGRVRRASVTKHGPVRFALGSMPGDAVGKIMRASRPRAGQRARRRPVRGPRDDNSASLMWAKTLSLKRVGIDEEFFASGDTR